MKVAIVGSREYTNMRKMKGFIFDLKNKFGDELIIISGGCGTGADKYAKKYALEFGISYKEYNPAHTPKNLYSSMHEGYYGKPYHVSQFFHRNRLIAKACDVCVAFIPERTKASGSLSTIAEADKLGKKTVIID